MSKTEVTLGDKAHDKILEGVDVISEIVGSTLGPAGRTVFIQSGFGGAPKSTKDGVTVAQSITLEDPIQDMGAQTVKEVAKLSNQLAGDGTTTATVIAQALVQNAFKAIKKGLAKNVTQFRAGMQDEAINIEDFLNSKATTFDFDEAGKEHMRKIAMISSNSDLELTDTLMEAFDIAKDYGAIKVDIGKSQKSIVKTVEGMTYANGMLSPHFSNQQDRTEWRGENALIFLTNYKISHLEEISGAIDYCHQNKRPLMIVCEDMDEMALRYLLTNITQGNLDACVVKHPGFGSQIVENLTDIAVVTGAKTILKDRSTSLRGLAKNKDIAYLGVGGTVVAKQHEFGIYQGGGKEETIKKHIERVKKQYEEEEDPYMKSKKNDRLARLMSGIAMIYVGGGSELEARERRDRIEDAMNAVRAAAEQGYILGGGLPLLEYSMTQRDQKDDAYGSDSYYQGKLALRGAVTAPFSRILVNADKVNEQSILNLKQFKSKSNGFKRSYDLFSRKDEFVDYEEAGIIDPVKVTVSALNNAVSICSTLITLSGTVHIIESNAPQMPML